ncbi:organoarsenical effux MFS transporter ArsJ [Marivivens sp. LCG002]|uniref:organoarsenical effux MFS transporter ArsJ n=1 Tax=Marivivens sp. LCG002 TaxID=3051171 RepID=UPI002553C8C0|nr:organoarsenical effux MFS transporter ArsJ [Marivivens sp. LCG002]WIV50434.1 organoarsenical effux MFS transporter ArsJ [Marivivens sp. LCG002]
MIERPLVAYGAVTASYWSFMLSDGALRMLVLLQFHTMGFSPVELAYLFVLYEVAGIVTNLSAGWIAARFGLASTLYTGLGLQIAALIALAQLDPDWSITASVVFVMAVQGVSGVAKDLAKMSSKSAVKLLAPEGEGKLFRWVALLTGSKNAVKGFGFFLGAGLLGLFGFVPSVLGMAAILGVILVLIMWKMPAGLPQGRKSAKFKEVFSKNRDVNWLSFARMFLFGARDVWFVVGIPVFFYSVLSDGTPDSKRAAFFMIGAFMAVWTVLYGIVQANAPRLLGGKEAPLPALVQKLSQFTAGLIVIPVILACIILILPQSQLVVGLVIVGLLVFGALFAINSSLHSYLILAFTTGERVTMDVGFYYMANAGGRLLGTLLSGATYQLGGIAACLLTAALLILLSSVGVWKLGRSR